MTDIIDICPNNHILLTPSMPENMPRNSIVNTKNRKLFNKSLDNLYSLVLIVYTLPLNIASTTSTMNVIYI